MKPMGERTSPVALLLGRAGGQVLTVWILVLMQGTQGFPLLLVICKVSLVNDNRLQEKDHKRKATSEVDKGRANA
jgi:hypothetical protein